MYEKSSKSWFLPFLAWCIGILGMTGVWFGIGVWRDTPSLWLSIIAVLDIALMLRVTGVNAGWPRFLAIVSGAVIIIVCSQWLIAANAFGLALGMMPLEAAKHIGSVLAWEFSRLRIPQVQWIYFPLSLLFAWYTGLRRPK